MSFSLQFLWQTYLGMHRLSKPPQFALLTINLGLSLESIMVKTYVTLQTVYATLHNNIHTSTHQLTDKLVQTYVSETK